MDRKTWIFGIIGAIAGIPASYYFQAKTSLAQFNDITDYLKHLSVVCNTSSMFSILKLTVMGGAIIGGIVAWVTDLIIDIIRKPI